MELDYQQKQTLLKRFPEFELSYETVSHKKVSCDYHLALAISTGKKYFAWFTFENVNDVCYLMELNKEKKISKITKVTSLFHNILCTGTILYGTVIDGTHDKQLQFVVEDIYMYKGMFLKQMCFGLKIHYLKECFSKYIVQRFSENEQNTQVYFALTYMWYVDNMDEYICEVIPEHIQKRLGYTPHHIQYRELHKIAPYVNINLCIKPIQVHTQTTTLKRIIPSKLYFMDFNKPQYKLKTVFQVCADIQYDIYHLYAFGKNKNPIYYNVAYIPNYKTSVFMNSLFRNIRENSNLDWIEESDDEEDFEDLREDKYVDLNKIINIECVFQPKFKKWIPLRVMDEHEKIVHITKLVNGYYE